ncbi:MAG: hypothetical protein GC154_18110 [bacterium]|nr:hypothetical protein [bacterium]
MKRKLQLLLILLIVGLFGTGVYFQKKQNPDQPVLVEEILAPLLELQQRVDANQPGLNEDAAKLAADIRTRFYALDDSPDFTPEERQRRMMEAAKNHPSDEIATNYFHSSGEVLSKMKDSFSDAVKNLNVLDAPDLARRMNEIYQRAQSSVEKTKEGVGAAVDAGKVMMDKVNDEPGSATN